MQIDVAGATLRYGTRIVFENFSATFANQEVTALTGPSGSGKSSLLAAMAGYQKLENGVVQFMTDDGHRSAPDSSMISWIPQGYNALGARSAIDNVMIGPLSEGVGIKAAAAIATDALNQVGLDHVKQQRARHLSGGELQRLSFARALASGKPVIFADEPSASLDEDNTRQIAQILNALRSRATLVVATHDPLLIAATDAHVSMRAEQ